MIRVNESIVIRRSPEEVWTSIANYEFDLAWRRGLTEMRAEPPGPAALGTTVNEVLRRGRQTYRASTVVDDFHPGSAYQFTGSGSSGSIVGRRSVEPADDPATARFTYEFDLRPTPLMRLLGPIASFVARAGMRRDLARLKVLLEQ